MPAWLTSVVVASILLLDSQVRPAFGQTCSNEDFAITYDGITYFTVNSANNTCICQQYIGKGGVNQYYGSSVFHGGVGVSGSSTSVLGGLSVAQSSLLNGAVTVNGAAQLNGGVTSTAATFTSTLSVTGTAIFNSNVGVRAVPTTPLQVFVPDATSSWSQFYVTSSPAWGDSGVRYLTLQGSTGVMVLNLHIPWHAPNGAASIRMGRSGGVASGAWYEVGVGTSDNFFVAKNAYSAGRQLEILASGLALLSSGLTVSGGVSTLNAGLTVNGGLSTLNAGLTVNGAVTTLNNGLNVGGTTNTGVLNSGSHAISGTLSVSSTSTFSAGFTSSGYSYHNGRFNIHAGGPYSVQNGRMYPGSLTVGDTGANYGVGWDWTGNTAGIMMECADNTEIAVHDAGQRVISLMAYQGGGSSTITIGRDMLWGYPTNVNINAGTQVTFNTGTVYTGGVISAGTSGPCCKSPYTISANENTAGNGRLPTIQFHSGGVCEGQIIMTVPSRNPGVAGGNAAAGLSRRGFVFGSVQDYADVFVTGNIRAWGVKSFVQQHPEDEHMDIVYVALEGPESAVYYRGHSSVEDGVADVELPDYFRLVASESGLTAQITQRRGCGGILVVDSLTPSTLSVRSEPDGANCDFDYFVQGKRVGFENHQPLQPHPDHPTLGTNTTATAESAK